MCARPLALVPLLVDVVKAERGSLRVNLLGVLLYICQVLHAPPSPPPWPPRCVPL